MRGGAFHGDSLTLAVPTEAEQQGEGTRGSRFGGTLTDDFLAQTLSARPGCAAAPRPRGGGTSYASIFPGNVIPSSCFDPTAADLMKQYVPLPNSAGYASWNTLYERNRADQSTLRIDHKLTDHQQLNAYYYFDDDFLAKPFAKFEAGGATLPGFGDLSNERFQQLNASGRPWA